MWKKIHRIVLKEITSFFLISLFVFLSLFMIGRFLRIGKTLVSLSLSVFDVLKLIFYLSPFIMFLLFPVACMLAIFLTFQRMESDKEILILKTGGISLYQLLPAPLIFLIMCISIHLAVSFYFMPVGLKRFKNTMLDMVKNKTKLSIRPGVFNTDIPGMVLYIQNLDKKKDLLKNIVINRKLEDRKSSVFIIAPYGTIKSDYNRGKLIFSLFNGSIYDVKKEKWNIIEFKTYIITLDLSKILKKINLQREKGEMFFWKEIKYVLNHPGKYAQTFLKKMEVERHKRISLPVACFVLGLFALSIAWLFHGIKRHLGILLMIFMFLVYYSLFSFSLNLGKLGYIPAFWAAWSPNFMFLFISLWLFYLSQQVK